MGTKIKISLGSRAPKGSKSIKSSKSSKGIRTTANMKRPQKGPKKPIPQQRRDSSSSLSSAPNLSDEDGYSAVEDVPESDDDEDEHVEAAEMEHIISAQRRGTAHGSSRPIHDSDDDDDDDDEEEENDDDGDDDDDDDDDDLANEDGTDDDMADEASFLDEDAVMDESSGNNHAHKSMFPLSAEENPDHPPTRHVRFTGVPESDSDSETEDDHGDLYPDLFVPQSALEPRFRREIEQGDESDSSASDTFWDHVGNNEAVSFHNDEADENPAFRVPVDNFDFMITEWANDSRGFHQRPMQPAMQPAVQPVTANAPSVEVDDSSEGYESDGETTEEDEPVLIPRRQATPEAPTQGDQTPTKNGKGKSPAGRLLINSRRKPICIVNPVTRKMMIIRPQNRQRFPSSASQLFLGPTTGLDSVQSSPIKNDSWWSQPLPFSNGVPIFSSPADLDLSAFGFEAVPDSEASFNEDDFGGEDDGEKDLNIDDFLNFDEYNEEDDDNAEQHHEDKVDQAGMPSRQPSTSSNDPLSIVDNPFLKHLTSIEVGAFRMNQANQKLIANGQATQDSLAFGNPLFHGTLRGIKQGNLKGAATPLTPERRHKKTLSKGPSETKQAKRKAPEAEDINSAHKRHRSISDVTQMHL